MSTLCFRISFYNVFSATDASSLCFASAKFLCSFFNTAYVIRSGLQSLCENQFFDCCNHFASKMPCSVISPELKLQGETRAPYSLYLTLLYQDLFWDEIPHSRYRTRFTELLPFGIMPVTRITNSDFFITYHWG